MRQASWCCFPARLSQASGRCMVSVRGRRIPSIRECCRLRHPARRNACRLVRPCHRLASLPCAAERQDRFQSPRRVVGAGLREHCFGIPHPRLQRDACFPDWILRLAIARGLLLCRLAALQVPGWREGMACCLNWGWAERCKGWWSSGSSSRGPRPWSNATASIRICWKTCASLRGGQGQVQPPPCLYCLFEELAPHISGSVEIRCQREGIPLDLDHDRLPGGRAVFSEGPWDYA